MKRSASDGRTSDGSSGGSGALSSSGVGRSTGWSVCWTSVSVESRGSSDSLTSGIELLGLSVDLLWLVVGDEVDLVGGSDWELEVSDGEGAAVLVLVGREEGVGWWVGGHVGEVDVEGLRISVDGVPLDLVGLGEIPDGVLSWGGDLESKGAGGQCEDGDLRKHLECVCMCCWSLKGRY